MIIISNTWKHHLLFIRKKSEEDRARYNAEMETYKLSQPPADAKDQSTLKQVTKLPRFIHVYTIFTIFEINKEIFLRM